MKAIWNGAVLAESSDTILVEGNYYFPPLSIKKELLENSNTTTSCSWKGLAHYYTIKVGDLKNVDAAWFYADPKDAAKNIQGYVAFWKGVKVSE